MAFSIAGVYRNAPIDLNKGIYFSFFKKVKLVEKGEDWRALFADEDIRAGEIIWVNKTEEHPTLKENRCSLAEINKMPEDQYTWFTRYIWQLDEDLWAGPPFEGANLLDAHNFWNHSCDPNVWLVADDVIAARRDIKKGEEMCFDYSTTDCVFMGLQECLCEAPNCRGILTTEDWQRKDLQIRYGNHFMSYLLRRIEQQHADDATAEDSRENLAEPSEEGLCCADHPLLLAPELSNSSSGLFHESTLGCVPKPGPEECITDSHPLNPMNNREKFGVGCMYTLHKDIRVGNCDQKGGKGLFAKKMIPKGTIVYHDHDHINRSSCITSRQISLLSEEAKVLLKSYFSQIDDDLFVGPTAPLEVARDAAVYMNHSCQPNVWFVSDTKMVACCDITPGEELCYDYATSEATLVRFAECKCNAAVCRGKCLGSDWARPDVQQRYSGHFLSYIQRRIDHIHDIIRTARPRAGSESCSNDSASPCGFAVADPCADDQPPPLESLAAPLSL